MGDGSCTPCALTSGHGLLSQEGILVTAGMEEH